jgi:predicted nucleic acid-binding protein
VRYLLDTNVISELRKPVGRAAPNGRAWGQHQATSELSISAITVMEIEIGIARRKWLERGLLAAFATRILPIDLAVIRRTTAMHVPDPRPERDVLLAATALTHSLVVVTRNISDFQPLGVELRKGSLT